MSRSRTFVLVAASAGLASGCSDYMNRYDGVTLSGGDAVRGNIILHTIDPFNPQSHNTKIEGDGPRAGNAVRKYQQGSGRANNDGRSDAAEEKNAAGDDEKEQTEN